MTVSPQASYQSIAARILGAERPSWTMRDGETWCMITPPGYRTRRQGWKLHVSATAVSAHEVLERAAGVLVAHGCAFKFAVSPSVTADLTGVRAARAHSGKFLTAYPADDDQLRLLAEELHRATAGLAGPVILSDRRYRPGREPSVRARRPPSSRCCGPPPTGWTNDSPGPAASCPASTSAAPALHDAARTLDDPELAARARQYALDIPLGIPLAATKPDICHGLSGAGLAQLHLWHATGDQRFAERASACADGVLRLLAEADGGVDWPLGPSYRSELAGSGSYGFGHGVAGNAAFLLAAGRDLDRPELLDIAIGGGHALCAVAERRGDIAVWPKGPGRTERTGLDFWCNGASGIGTTLVRLWQETGEPRFGEYADLAARTAHRDRWRLGTGTCHGVAGNAQLLLDLAAATGDETYRTRAAEAAACLHALAALRDGRLVVPDDTCATSASATRLAWQARWTCCCASNTAVVAPGPWTPGRRPPKGGERRRTPQVVPPRKEVRTMEETVLELQELPETDEQALEPAMCCDTLRTSGQ